MAIKNLPCAVLGTTGVEINEQNFLQALRAPPEVGRYTHAVQEGEGFHNVPKNLLCPKMQRTPSALMGQ